MDAWGEEEMLVGYAVDPVGQAPPGQVVGELLQGLELEHVPEMIEAYGLEAVAEQYLRSLIEDGTLHADPAAARAERERLLDDEEAFGLPKVHEIGVAELADELTRIGLIEPPPSCRG